MYLPRYLRGVEHASESLAEHGPSSSYCTVVHGKGMDFWGFNLVSIPMAVLYNFQSFKVRWEEADIKLDL